MIAYLYLITNTTNGKCYVGVAINPKDRWRNHRKLSQRRINSKHYDDKCYLHRAMAQDGIVNFTFEVIACAPSWEDGLTLERVLIAQHGTFATDGGYNLTRGGEGKPGGFFSAETRAKIGASTAMRKHTAETRAKIGTSLKGRYCSPETRAKRSASMTKYLEEHPERRAATSARLIGKRRSPETVAKMSVSAKIKWAQIRAVVDGRQLQLDF